MSGFFCRETLEFPSLDYDVTVGSLMSMACVAMWMKFSYASEKISGWCKYNISVY